MTCQICKKEAARAICLTCKARGKPGCEACQGQGVTWFGGDMGAWLTCESCFPQKGK